jgi:branched-chain amino acid transport system substrate-binding protein
MEVSPGDHTFAKTSSPTQVGKQKQKGIAMGKEVFMRSPRRVGRAWVILPVLALVLAACSSNSSSSTATSSTSSGPTDVKVAFLGPLTGDAAVYGISTGQGFDLAVDDVNKAGKIHLSTTKVDTKADPTLAVSGVQKLIDQGYHIIVGGVLSGETLPVAAVCQAKKVICFTPGATNPAITKVGDYIFRAISTTPREMQILMENAAAKGLHNAAVLYDDGAYGSAGAAAVKANWPGLGGKVVAYEAYTSGGQDFRAQLGKIKQAKPDVIFVPGYYTDLGLAVRQARSLGITTLFAGPSGLFSPDFVKIAGAQAAEGTLVSTDFSPGAQQSALVTAFIAEIKAKYNLEPDENHALGYDTVMMIAKALGQVPDPSNTEAVKNALAAITYDGVTGANQTFQTPAHDINKELIVLKVSNGAFVPAK